MLPSQSAAALSDFLKARGVASVASVDQVVPLVFDFYEAIQVSGLDPGPDSDMLLFQYGVYDLGQGESFQLDITRQFILAGLEDDDAISQVHCTTYFAPSAQLRAVPAFNAWCQSPSELAAFSEIVFTSAGYKVALGEEALRREIWWEQI